MNDWSSLNFRSKDIYIYEIEGVEKNYEKLPFGRALESAQKAREFCKSAKEFWVNCKGKPSLPEIKKTIKILKKEHGKKLQFFVKWQKDSEFYKDDVICIYYTAGDEK